MNYNYGREVWEKKKREAKKGSSNLRAFWVRNDADGIFYTPLFSTPLLKWVWLLRRRKKNSQLSFFLSSQIFFFSIKSKSQA
jgi:hypothetical protein